KSSRTGRKPSNSSRSRSPNASSPTSNNPEALPAYTHNLTSSGGVGHRPPLLAYPLHQQQAPLERQPSITVGHEDLRDLVVTLDKPHLTRRSSSRQRTTASVTNVLAGYS